MYNLIYNLFGSTTNEINAYIYIDSVCVFYRVLYTYIMLYRIFLYIYTYYIAVLCDI